MIAVPLVTVLAQPDRHVDQEQRDEDHEEDGRNDQRDEDEIPSRVAFVTVGSAYGHERDGGADRDNARDANTEDTDADALRHGPRRRFGLRAIPLGPVELLIHRSAHCMGDRG